MILIDIAGIVFICVTMNHLGLIGKLEEIMGEFPIFNCPKCCTFWCVLTYGLSTLGINRIITVLAISFLASYSALWLELFEAYIDTLYLRHYEKINPADPDDTASSDTDGGN